MNRNVESHFSQLPRSEIQRSRFDRSAPIKTSFNSGELIPFYVEEVLPGDTFDVKTAKVVRAQTMLTPVMSNMYLDTYYFFVPNRLVYKNWKAFCGENTQGAWAPTVDYTLPCIVPPEGGFKVGTIADYLGLPVGVEWKADDDLAPSVLPFRAYALICNEFFRDQNLSDPLLIPTDDANQQGVNDTGNYIIDVANGGKPFVAAKYHDYFTSCLPSPQKGDPVGIPISVPVFNGGVFPVTTVSSDTFGIPASAFPLNLVQSTSDNYNTSGGASSEFTVQSAGLLSHSPGNTSLKYEPVSQTYVMAPANLAATIPAQVDNGIAEVSFSVNELRLAFAYQRYLENISRSGSRYTELLSSLFGVTSEDARLQRPEYLGGNRVTINVNEVTNNAQSEQDFLGDLGAKSKTGDVHKDFVKSFTEHGILMGLMVVRYDHAYAQGLQRFWTRRKFTDFYNPKFAHLGEMPVYQAEIFANGNFTKDRIFGYQEAWADYRYRPAMITGEMRPNVENSLAFWHLGDNYATTPTLSDGWIREDPRNVDRVLAVTSAVSNQFWCDIYVENWCTRCMPMYSVPGLIDHF